jgi:ATP-dependent exoDNAse (exonuclease V) beta subunit
VAGEYHDKLYPAIERVWKDGIDSIRADLREWLRRMADDPEWLPRRFELAFGLDQREGRDPASVADPVELSIGIKLRGSIDLVEEGPNGAIRATDHKTGKPRVERGALIAGGKSLQPTLYALALERIFPEATVSSGRLYYCTTRGDFTDVNVPLDDDARGAAQLLAKTLTHYFEEGFFPAAPAKDECKYCDFKRVCGPYEEMRLKKKDTKAQPARRLGRRDDGLPTGRALLDRTELDKTRVVEAAAGTGKTTEMITRIIAVIETGATTLERLVAVTFTEKAAGEMKLRLRTELETQREKSTGIARVRLEQALAALEIARIGSIHSFCADLLRERPIEARVDPLFDVAAEDETERLYNQAFEGWFQRTLGDPPEGVRRILRRHEPTELLRKAGWGLVDRRDFDGAWRRDPFDRDAELDRIVRELGSLTGYLPLADKPDKDPARLFARLQRWLLELARRDNVRPRDHDGLESELAELFRWWEWKYAGRGNMYGANLTRADVIMRRDAVRRAQQFLQAQRGPRLHAELRPLVGEYERLKARTGKLDFLDLLAKTRNLLRDDPTVRAEMQARYTHFFIDEFQDTDPLQIQILLLLCADDHAVADPAHVKVKPGKLFVVGDPKQAIASAAQTSRSTRPSRNASYAMVQRCCI